MFLPSVYRSTYPFNISSLSSPCFFPHTLTYTVSYSHHQLSEVINERSRQKINGERERESQRAVISQILMDLPTNRQNYQCKCYLAATRSQRNLLSRPSFYYLYSFAKPRLIDHFFRSVPVIIAFNLTNMDRQQGVLGIFIADQWFFPPDLLI